jgi:HlyD family secretion protein
MSPKQQEFKSLRLALEDHSSEGIAILTSEPSRLIQTLIYLIGVLLLSILIWSFFGSADIMVTAVGTLLPEAEVRRVYTPIDGELENIYVTEGTPVLQGDVLARINAREAVEVAAKAMKADLDLANAERDYRLFPGRRELMQLKLASLREKMNIQQEIYQRLELEGTSKLAEQQRNKLEKARLRLRQTLSTMEAARRDLDAYENLFRMPGGGGVARQQVEEKRNAYRIAQTQQQLAETDLADLAIQLTEEPSKKKTELKESFQELMKLRVEYETELENLKNEENRVEMALQSARLAAEAATRVNFDNVDEGNFLRVLSPLSGVIIEVAYTQAGDKVQAHKPLLGIAPAGTRSVLQVEIEERDRGFLKEGLPVKVKFTAFPYQRYGFLDGTLEYISPATVISTTDQKRPVYKGRVGIERDYFMVDDVKRPLRYGMTATAEIVVRKRRLIDMALDPLRTVSS